MRDGFGGAGGAGANGITEVWRHAAARLPALIPFFPSHLEIPDHGRLSRSPFEELLKGT